MDLRRKLKRTICKLCHKKKTNLSSRGLCPECSTKLNQNSVAQMRAKNGPVYEKWHSKLLKAMENLE